MTESLAVPARLNGRHNDIDDLAGQAAALPGTVGDAHDVLVGIPTAGCDQGLAQGLELGLVGLEAPQVRGGV